MSGAGDELPLAVIRRDGGTQPRSAIDASVVQEYAEAILDGCTLPAVVVFYDGAEYWLADGFHRYAAHQDCERQTILSDIRQGDRRDAVLYSVGANATHGYRRSTQDKRRAVLTLLNDADWSAWSDREIARRCVVSAPFVATLRPPRVTENTYSEPARTYVDRHGNTSTMKIAGLQRRELPPIAGHVPDRKPMPEDLRPASGSCGIAEASLISGFDAKRLKAFAALGVIEGVEQEAGRLYFDHAKLRAWMATPDPEPAVHATGEARHAGCIPDTTPEQDALVADLFDLFDLFDRFAGLGTPAVALEAWGLFLGQALRPETVSSAAAWLVEFAEKFPEAEAQRAAQVSAMLEKVEADVIA